MMMKKKIVAALHLWMIASVDAEEKPKLRRRLEKKMMMMGKGKGAPPAPAPAPPPMPLPMNYHPCGYSTEDPVSPNGVVTLAPEGGIIPTATWSLGTRAGDFVYVAGMRGIDPAANALVPDAVGRVRQAFLSIVLLLMWRICRFS